MQSASYEVEIVKYTSEEGGRAYGIEWSGLPSIFPYHVNVQPTGFCTKGVYHTDQVVDWQEKFVATSEFATFSVASYFGIKGPEGTLQLSGFVGRNCKVDLPLLCLGQKTGTLTLVVSTNVCQSCRKLQEMWCDTCDLCQDVSPGCHHRAAQSATTMESDAELDAIDKPMDSCGSSSFTPSSLHQPRMDEKAFYELEFRRSLTNTFIKLFFETLDIHVLPVKPEAEAALVTFAESLPASCKTGERAMRYVFHSAPESVVSAIAVLGLRPSHCDMCLRIAAFHDHDDGLFGDHTKGVYVSKHADYTTFYNKHREPREGDEGFLVMFKTVIGRSKQFTQKDSGCRPSPGYNCHVSPNLLEYFLYDDNTLSDPPRPCERLIPVAVIKWRAVLSRAGIIHETGPLWR